VASEEHMDETNGEDERSNGGTNGHNLGRVAAIAAASGATAYAAKKALSARSSSSGQADDDRASDKKSGSSSQSNATLLSTVVASGWHLAKDSLLPVVEDAATKAGAFVAERAPEVVRDVVVPRFIAGFERARRGKRGDDKFED
jgi:hypothetical protein